MPGGGRSEQGGGIGRERDKGSGAVEEVESGCFRTGGFMGGTSSGGQRN